MIHGSKRDNEEKNEGRSISNYRFDSKENLFSKVVD